MDYGEKMQEVEMGKGFREYVEALEEERRKIQVFQRELPLCLELVSQAIESCRQQLSGTTTEHLNGGQSESSEQTSSEGPVLEEFIPIKRAASISDFDGEEQRPNKSRKDHKNIDKKKAGQSDWLKSAQLWNQSPDPPLKENVTKKASVVEVKRNGGAFQPFHRENIVVSKTEQTACKLAPVTTTSSTAETASGSSGGSSGREEKGQTQRKQRRSWSPELHRRFLRALEHLGGSHVATPKQIRELMKVDGLTNDEVKSHLQKYRLHTTRPSPPPPNNGTVQPPPQFVVVGGIWVQPPDYAAVATTGEAASVGAANPIYAPVAAAPAPPSVSETPATVLQRPKPKPKPKLSDQSRLEERGVKTNSPATSSSTHTTTTTTA